MTFSVIGDLGNATIASQRNCGRKVSADTPNSMISLAVVMRALGARLTAGRRLATVGAAVGSGRCGAVVGWKARLLANRASISRGVERARKPRSALLGAMNS